jgi:hypothetical protein
MRLLGATIGSLAFTISIACGGAERSGDMVTASGSASALSSDCTGLVPAAVPSGFSTTVQLSDACGPMGATSDGRANYAVGKTCGGTGFESWALVDGTGAQRASGPAFRTTFDAQNERQERHVLAQPAAGFLAFHWVEQFTGSAFQRTVSLRAYSGDGAQTGEHFFINLTGATRDSFPDRSWSLAPPPAGGAQVSHVSLPGDGSWHLYTQRLSSSATPMDGVQQLATAFNSSVPQQTLTGVATGGQALIAWDNGTEGRAVWTDAVGHLSGGTFSLGFRVDGHTAVSPLLDGTLAFNQAGQWISTIAPGSHAVAAAPSWLSTRPGSQLFLVRGGRGHGLFTQPPQGSCQAHLVLFAPAGNRCGAVDLPSADANGCATTAEIGLDGTVIVQGQIQFSDSGDFPTQSVAQRFYPQLLQ